MCVPGQLASYLVEGFTQALPSGWQGEPEFLLLSKAQAKRLGYMPRADLVLHAPDGRKVALEFEISRADPVANQAKLLVAYESGALGRDDAFGSLLSPHLQRGRRNLAALFTRYMRGGGLPAFGVSLLPGHSGEEIARLNHLASSALQVSGLDVAGELRRVLEVTEPRGEARHRIHFAGDATDVMANLWAWNDAMGSTASLTWESRRTQFWVADVAGGQFAPSKFCAFIPAAERLNVAPGPTMTPEIYALLGEDDARFDGHRARRHLVDRLCFREGPPTGRAGEAWAAWRAKMGARISLRGEVTLLMPPPWL
jgi:hypothetical protein